MRSSWVDPDGPHPSGELDNGAPVPPNATPASVEIPGLRRPDIEAALTVKAGGSELKWRAQAIGVDVRLYNHRLRRARKEMGYQSRAGFAKMLGVSSYEYGRLEGLRCSPITQKGDLRRIARRIVEETGHPPAYLWPEELRDLRTKGIEVFIERSFDREASRFDDFDRDLVFQALSCLPERQKKMVALYFGLGQGEECTPEEIGKRMGCTRERVVQLVKKSLVSIKRTVGEASARALPGPPADTDHGGRSYHRPRFEAWRRECRERERAERERKEREHLEDKQRVADRERQLKEDCHWAAEHTNLMRRMGHACEPHHRSSAIP